MGVAMKQALTILLAVVASLAGVYMWGPQGGAEVASRETAYERVMASNTIRCGYFIWPPFLVKDPNTGVVSGAIHELVEEIGKQLSMKIEWVAEVDVAHMIEGLHSGRYDAICAPLTPTPGRAREVSFATSFGYAGVHLWVRPDDTRFDHNFAAVNHPDVRFSMVDGEYSSLAAMKEFPDATPVSLSQAAGSEMLLQVASGKADVTLTDEFSFALFNASNPGKLRPVKGGPLHVLPVTPLAILKDSLPLKDMLDITINNLNDNGYIERLSKKYEHADAKILRLAKPYEVE